MNSGTMTEDSLLNSNSIAQDAVQVTELQQTSQMEQLQMTTKAAIQTKNILNN